MTEERVTYDVAQAQAVIDADHQRRAEECGKIVNEALAQFRCIATATVFVDGKPVPVSVQLVAQ